MAKTNDALKIIKNLSSNDPELEKLVREASLNLEAIKKLMSDRSSKVDESARENPWTDFIGMFKGDPELEEMSVEWQTERNRDEDEVI